MTELVDYDQPTTLPEPGDGERRLVDQGDGVYRVIWRDNARAARNAADHGADPADRWFDSDEYEEGRSWVDALAFADAIYPLDPGSRIAVLRACRAWTADEDEPAPPAAPPAPDAPAGVVEAMCDLIEAPLDLIDAAIDRAAQLIRTDSEAA